MRVGTFKTRVASLADSYIHSNFNYCRLVWHFSSANSVRKVEKIQERALRFLYKDNDSSYLLRKAGKNFMHVSQLRSLCIEIHKAMKNKLQLLCRKFIKLVKYC